VEQICNYVISYLQNAKKKKEKENRCSESVEMNISEVCVQALISALNTSFRPTRHDSSAFIIELAFPSTSWFTSFFAVG
jgi:hypothetical protein